MSQPSYSQFFKMGLATFGAGLLQQVLLLAALGFLAACVKTPNPSQVKISQQSPVAIEPAPAEPAPAEPASTDEKLALPELKRGTVFIAVTEELDDEIPKLNISQKILEMRFARHGFEIADNPEAARYRVTGHLKCRFFEEVNFEFKGTETHLEYKFKAEGGFELFDSQAKDPAQAVEGFAYTKPMFNGRTSMVDAIRDIRRKAASEQSLAMLRGRTLGPSFISLFDALGDDEETRSFNEIEQELLGHGVLTVPYLLDELVESRAIVVSGKYPGMTASNRDQFKRLHFADSLLSKLFKKNSGLKIDSTDQYVLRVQTAWAWAWEARQSVPKQYQTVSPRGMARKAKSGS